MKTKVFSGIMPTMLLIGMLTLAFNIQPVKADWTWTETVYIRADGSVEPPDAPISSVDNITYTFTDNIDVNIVEAEPAIVVQRDDIVVDGSGYTFQGNNGYCGIDLTGRTNITIKNLKIKGNYFSIYLSGSSNCNIYKNNITDNGWGHGVFLSGCSNNNIFRNNITAGECGIYVSGSSNNIYGNNLKTCERFGIKLSSASSNVISGNSITDTREGIGLRESSNNIIYHNNFINNTNQVDTENSVNVWDDGYPSGGNYWSDHYHGDCADHSSGPDQKSSGSDGIVDYPYVIDANNTDIYPLMQPYHGPVRNLNTGQSYPTIQGAINNASEGDTIFALSGTYYESPYIGFKSYITLLGESSYTTIVNGSITDGYCPFNITIKNFKILGGVNSGSQGLGTGRYRTIANNIIYNGLTLHGSYHTVEDNVIYGGINLREGYHDAPWMNEIINNTLIGDGIDLDSGVYITIEKNTIMNASIGIFEDHVRTSSGSSHSNTFVENSISFCDIGIYFRNDWAFSPSSGSLVFGNTFYNNTYGIKSEWVDSIKVYHNNFINNSNQFFADLHPTFNMQNNTLDDGYPSGGNYWSDYTDQDFYKGPNQDEAGSDGIWDNPYVIDANNTDCYPLTKPYGGPHDIGITNITTFKTVVGQGYNLSMIVKTLNYGINSETFNITVYANTTVINQTQITLTSRNSTTITFMWNTTGVPYGNYTITANATTVLGETDTADNTYTDCWVVVTIPGDANGDGHVNLWDLSLLSDAWLTESGEPNYNSNADFNGDGDINIWDLGIMSDHWLESIV